MAADTFSALLGFLKQGTGNNNNTWGALLNTGCFDEIDLAIAGRLAISTTGGTTDLSASPPPAGPSAAIYAILDLSGTLGSNAVIQVPNLSKIWLVNNACVLSTFTVKFKTPSGSASSAIPVGWCMVWCDGNNVCSVGISTSNRDVQWLVPDGTLAAPGIAFSAEPGTGLRRKGTQDVVVVVNGVDILEVTGAGASSPSVVNVLSPNALQIQGVQVVPSGAEIDYSGLVEPTGWYFPVGQAKSRTTDAALFAAIAPNTISGVAITGNTHTSTTLDNLTVDLRNMGLVGATIEGTGIPSGTTISAIGSATALTLSQAATGTATGIAIRVLPYGQGDASTTFNLPDRRGAASFIRDDLGGTAKGKLSNSATGGIDGTKLSATGGEQAHTLTQAELPAVAPTATFTGTPSISVLNATTGTLTGIGGASPPFALQTPITPAGTIAISNLGSGNAQNNVPPATICNRLIRR